MSLVWHTLGAYLHRILSFDRRVRVRVYTVYPVCSGFFFFFTRGCKAPVCQTAGLREEGPAYGLLVPMPPFHLTSPLWPTIDLI